MKKPIEDREAVLLAFLGGEISKQKAADILSCTTRTIENYRNLYRKSGQEGLKDHRHSNYYKLNQEAGVSKNCKTQSLNFPYKTQPVFE